MKREKVGYPDSLEMLKQQGLDFVEALEKLTEDGLEATLYEIVDALGLSRQGLTAAQTVASGVIMQQIKSGGDGFQGMKVLFGLGVDLGVAYGRLVERRLVQ